MKKCTWCGKEYPDEAERCSIDQEPLRSEPPQTAQADQRKQSAQPAIVSARRAQPVEPGSAWQPKFIDLEKVDGAFKFCEGYPRPDWKVIAETIKKTVPEENVSAAFTEAAIQWAEQVAANLGADYLVRGSDEFVLMSALDSGAAKRFLSFAEATRKRIYALLRDAAWKGARGRHVIFCLPRRMIITVMSRIFMRTGFIRQLAAV